MVIIFLSLAYQLILPTKCELEWEQRILSRIHKPTDECNVTNLVSPMPI